MQGTDIALILLLDMLLLAAIIAITIAVSRATGLSYADRMTLLFCGSTKSLASGVPIANILFVGHPISLIVLPLMIFHQIQLFACAIIAQRHSQSVDAGVV